MLDFIKDTFKSFGNGVKAFFVGIGTIVAGIATISLYIFIKEKNNEKIDKKIEELNKRSIKNEAIIDYNNQNIEVIESKEEHIKNRIEEISKEENKESLEEFFNRRGFWCIKK